MQSCDLFRLDATNGTIGPSLRWNILNYGRLVGGIRVQDARFQELAATYQETVLRANEEVENALVGFLQSQQQVKLLSESMHAAGKASGLTVFQYQEGKVDFNRVFDLQVFLAQQEDLHAQASGEVTQNLIEIYRALGGGWQIRLSNSPTGAVPAPGAQPEAAPPGPEIMPSPPSLPDLNGG